MRLFYNLTLFFVLFISSNYLTAQCPTLVWSDEFDGTELDLTKWEPQIGDGCAEGICGWGNNELQYYKAENAVVSNGTLKIIAKKERVKNKAYTSARIRTKDLADFTFGRFEAKIKLLEGQGLWPAFWMLSTNESYGGWPQSGEIDIMELIGQHPETMHGTIHYGDPYPNNQFQGTHFDLYDGSKFADNFHVFAIEWEPGEIRWYVDDVLYQTLTDADVLPYNWPFDAGNQMHFLLNVAVGGNWPGDPDETTPFPSQMEIDYVRVYDMNFNPSISGNRLVPYQSSGDVYTINNAPNGSSYNWTVPAGATITSGDGTSSIIADWGDTGGTITCDVTTDCITKQYNIGVVVEPNFIYDFSFENFDDPANVTLNSTTGTLTEVNNPDVSGVNTSAISAEYIRDSQEQFDVISYATSSIADASLYEARQKKFFMDVLTQAPAGTEIIVQLESSADATASNYPIGRHSRYVGKITKNGEWERIVFDYLDSPDGSTADNSVDQIIILFASNSFTGDTYYWDNFDGYKTDDGGTTNASPTASFTYSASDMTADFDGSGSSDSDGTISSWDWDFGDGNAGSGQIVSHTYGTSGDYTVTLTVTDDEGASDMAAPQLVSVTDGSTGDATTLHVQSVVTGTENAGKGNKRGTATVTIHDDQENPVADAIVAGTFSGTFNESVSGTTGSDGIVTFTTTGTAKGTLTVNFCVDGVTHSTLTYDATQNDITCTGSLSFSSTESLTASTSSENFRVYPNPFSNRLTLQLKLEEETNIDVRIYNAIGVQVITEQRYSQSIQEEIRFDLSEIRNGIYYLIGRMNNETINVKLIKE